MLSVKSKKKSVSLSLVHLVFIFVVIYFISGEASAQKLNSVQARPQSYSGLNKEEVDCLEKNPYTIQIYSDINPENISRSKIFNSQEINLSSFKFLVLNLDQKTNNQWFAGYLGLFANKQSAENQLKVWLDKDLIPYDSFVYRLSHTQLQRIKIEVSKKNQTTYQFAKQVICSTNRVSEDKKVKEKVIRKKNVIKKTKTKSVTQKKIEVAPVEGVSVEKNVNTIKAIRKINPYYQLGLGAHIHLFQQEFRNIGEVDHKEVIPIVNYFIHAGVVVNNVWSLGLQYRSVQTKMPKIEGVLADKANSQTTHLNLLLKSAIFESYTTASQFLGLKYGEHKINYLKYELINSKVTLNQNDLQTIGIGYTYKMRHRDLSEGFEASIFYDHVLKSKSYKPKSQYLFEVDYGYWIFNRHSFDLGLFMNHSIYKAQNYPIYDVTTEDYKSIQQINSVLELRGQFD